MNRERCRTCLRHCEDLISLFDYDFLHSNKRILFADMLVSISYEVSSTDNLPKKVCQLCVSAIRTCYFFQLEAKKSLEILQNECVSIKQEASETRIAVILSPRHLAEEQFREDMLLDEIQNHHNINLNSSLNESDQEIIDYEPELETGTNDDDDGPEEYENERNTEENIAVSTLNVDTKEISEGLIKKHECNVCKKIFINTKALVSHCRFHQANNCLHCDKRFLNSTQLKLHVRAKHPEYYESFRLGYQEASVRVNRIDRFHECTQCSQKLISFEALLLHHGKCDNTCVECGLKMPRSDLYFKHLEMVHSIQLLAPPSSISNIECPFCFLSFNDRVTIQEHIQQCHPDEISLNDSVSEAGESTSNDGFIYQCPSCPAKFQTVKGLNQHKTLKHSNNARSKNDVAPLNRNVKKYTREEFLEKFMVKKSKDFYRCVPCKKEIGIRSIVLHMRSKHAAVRSFRCELCSQAFFRADYRQRHVASNHPNSFKCSSCNIQFDRIHKIDAHNNSYHNIPIRNSKPEEGQDIYDLSPNAILYIESVKNYDYSDDFIQPTNNFSPFDCHNHSTTLDKTPMTKDEFCEKYISYVSERIVHCNECQQDIQKNSLISHLLWKHSVEKPLKCPFCNQRVVKNNARLLHMAKCHPNQYKCFDCNTQFVKHQHLVDHCEEMHVKRCNVLKSSGEMEDLQLTDMRFVTNKNEDDAIEDDIINGTEIINFANSNLNQEKKFHCPQCNKSFTSSKNLLIHKSHKHKIETVSSDLQNLSNGDNDDSMSYEEFRYNWTEDVNENSVRCLVCEQTLKKKNLINHLKARHCTIGAYLCEICGEHFFKPEDRLQHFSSQHKGIFYCDVCNIQHVCNSRYARHMKELHGIEMDHNDRVEVDLNVNHLRFVPSIRKANSDELRSVVNSDHQDDDEEEENMDPMEEMMQQMSNSEEMNRNDFMVTYFRSINRDTKHCTACNKTFQTSSLYHHLVHFHATTFPYKCPFCELRLERSATRARHMQIFHPNQYKCNMCGIQFQKHAKFADHMNIEHGQTVLTGKSPHEEEDISTADLRYVANRIGESTVWQEEESIDSINSYQHLDESNDQVFVKNEGEKSQTILEEIVLQRFSEQQQQPFGTYSYQDFKEKFMKNIDNLTYECIPCKRVIIKTSVCAHLRLWHATKMMFNCELCSIGFRRHDYRQRHMASVHPQDFLCTKCNQQFYRSSIYVDHMKSAHKVSVSIPESKSKDEIDVPLENLNFAPNVPDSERTHPDESVRTKRRLSIASDDRPINPKAGGLKYKDFCLEYIREENDSMRCLPCGEIFSKLSIKKHMKKQHATSRPYNCELCDESFFRMDERMSHMKSAHNNSLRCSICDIQFYMSLVFVMHMQSQHGQSVKALTSKGKTDVDVPIERLRFVINNGQAVSTTISSHKKKIIDEFNHIPDDAEMTREQFSKKFLRAIKPKTGDPQTKCMGCQKVFSSKNRYFHILHNHVVKRPFGCEFCSMRFFTSFKRIKHMAHKHPQKLTCSDCNIQFERTLNHALHMKENHQILIDASDHSKTLDISNDQLRYTKKSTSVREISKEQQKDGIDASLIDFPSSSSIFQDLKCYTCDLEFDSSRSYRSHMRDHGGSNEPDGLIRFNKPLDNNIKVEEPSRVECFFSCDKCEKKFSSKFALNAHKKFKHGVNLDGSTVVSRRKVDKQLKFDVECEICNFSSFRRDYVEHHIKQAHKGEFYCGMCARQLSNYNYFLHHMSLHTFESNEEEASYKSAHFKCDSCEKFFKFEKSKIDHQNSKHCEGSLPKRSFYCHYCNVNYHSKSNFEVHLEGYKHKNLMTFLDGIMTKSPIKIKEEQDDGPTNTKRPRLEESSEICNEDKLDYLKYLEELPNGNFKCGLCGKTKLSRKFLLHHLKQHEEVPTFNCEQCPERFVFKKKYDKHMKMHENSSDRDATKELIVDEHPKFQENVKASDIQCDICKITFKLTIMLNKHNSTWHAEENPNRLLSVQEQKQKSKESGTIKLHRCEFCTETYYKAEKLAEHMENVHCNKFKCEKCNLTFVEEQFLLNHQKLFCIHRSNTSTASTKDLHAKIMNEQ